MEYEEEEEELEQPRRPDLPLRSLHSNQKCKVYIRNRSSRPVSVFWLNYRGEEQQYFVVEPNQLQDVNTFATHPWVFRDSARNTILPVNVHKGVRNDRQMQATLVASNLRVFHPPAVENEQEVVAVFIMDQIYSLRDICYQKFIDLNVSYEELAMHVPSNAICDFELFRTGLPLSEAVQNPSQVDSI